MDPIKNFSQFITESNNDLDPKEIKDLIDLGVLDIEDAIDSLITAGVQLDSLFSPTDASIKIVDHSDFDDGFDQHLKPALLGWRGKHDEWVLFAEVELWEESFAMQVVLSTGSRLNLEWGERGHLQGDFFDLNGNKSSLSPEQEDDYWEFTYDGEDQVLVYTTLLDMTAGLAY
jgi:hypothetical protein